MVNPPPSGGGKLGNLAGGTGPILEGGGEAFDACGAAWVIKLSKIPSDTLWIIVQVMGCYPPPKKKLSCHAPPPTGGAHAPVADQTRAATMATPLAAVVERQPRRIRLATERGGGPMRRA